MTFKKMPTDTELQEAVKNEAQRMTVEELGKYTFEALAIPAKDMISLHDFFQYLISPERSKAFITNPDSPVAKNKDVLMRRHKCKIRILEGPNVNKN